MDVVLLINKRHATCVDLGRTYAIILAHSLLHVASMVEKIATRPYMAHLTVFLTVPVVDLLRAAPPHNVNQPINPGHPTKLEIVGCSGSNISLLTLMMKFCVSNSAY